MISLEAIVIIISAVCQFDNPNYTQLEKELCMERFVNCTKVSSKGETEERIEQCMEKVKI